MRIKIHNAYYWITNLNNKIAFGTPTHPWSMLGVKTPFILSLAHQQLQLRNPGLQCPVFLNSYRWSTVIRNINHLCMYYILYVREVLKWCTLENNPFYSVLVLYLLISLSGKIFRMLYENLTVSKLYVLYSQTCRQKTIVLRKL